MIGPCSFTLQADLTRHNGAILVPVRQGVSAWRVESECLTAELTVRMASSATQFEVGEIINVNQGAQWVPGIILDIQAPLGFNTYLVLEIDTGKTHSVTRLQIEKMTLLNTAVQADDIIDFVELPAEKPTEKPTEKPSGDPGEKPKARFEKMDPSEVDDLQMNAKSDKTHVNTRWGVKIFRGEVHFYT